MDFQSSGIPGGTSLESSLKNLGIIKLQTCCFNVTVNQLEIPYVTRRKKVLSAYIHAFIC